MATSVRSALTKLRAPVSRGSKASFHNYAAAEFVNHPQTQVTVLSNGLRVATEKSPSNKQSASVGVFIDAGSRYETKENNGVAHFLEHLAFKGTANRSRVQLEKEVENIGGQLNAYTSREQTVFYAQVLKDDIGQATDILSDILLRSKYSEESIEAERNVILHEMDHVYENQEEYVLDQLHESAFPDSGLGRVILGPVENIKKISRDDIVQFVNSHYTTDRMVIAATGAVDHDELVKLVEDKFSTVRQSPEGPAPVKDEPKFLGNDIKERWDKMDKGYMAYAFPTCGWAHADTLPLQVCHSLLGSYQRDSAGQAQFGSKLVARLSADEGIESFHAFNTLYSDTGLFGLYGVAGDTSMEEMTHAFCQETARLSYDVEDDLLLEAKNQIASNYISQLDAGSAQALEDVGRQMLTYGRRIHPTEYIRRLETVDTNAVMQTALKYFNDKDHVMASYGGTYEVPDYNWVRARSFWKRF